MEDIILATAEGKKERRRNMPTSKRSFGLILLHAAVCPVGRKLTSPCLPARNKIRFSARQFVPAPVWAQLANSLVKRFVSRSFRVTVLIPCRGRKKKKRRERNLFIAWKDWTDSIFIFSSIPDRWIQRIGTNSRRRLIEDGTCVCNFNY